MIDTRAVLAVAALALALPLGCSSSDKSSEKPKEPTPATPAAAAPEVLTVERSASGTLSARVKAINHSTRGVTLEDAHGHTAYFVAGPQVQRLDEVRVGDTVAADYSVSLIAERRAPTAEEAANPIIAIGATGRAPQGSDPAAGGVTGARVVTTVQAVDLAKMLVTLKGPMGDTVTIRARSAENIKKLHVGDTIIITWTEALVVSLVKQ